MMTRLLAVASVLIAAVVFSASRCGGGGYSNSSSYSTPRPPAAGANLATGTQVAAPPVKLSMAASFGSILTDPNGLTLYIRKSDTGGQSSCTGACATTWPPLITQSPQPAKPDGLTGDLGTTTRDGGALQVTFGGQPLYTYAGDKVPGDANGQGIGGVWFVATVTAASPTASATSGSPAATASAAPPAALTTPAPPPAAPTTAPPAPATAPAPTVAPTPAPAPTVAPTATPHPPAPPTPTPTVYSYPYNY